MKTLILSLTLVLSLTALNGYSHPLVDTMKLQTDSAHNTYYQSVVKVGDYNGLGNGQAQLYARAVQFMATKNFVQNYSDDQNGKLIFTSTQDLNINRAYVGDYNEGVQPYTVQFAITLDLRDFRYQYTINNVVFFIPEGGYNRRETLFDIYLKANNTTNKSIAKSAYSLIASFERYLSALTAELKQSTERRSPMYNSSF